MIQRKSNTDAAATGTTVVFNNDIGFGLDMDMDGCIRISYNVSLVALRSEYLPAREIHI